MGTASFRSASGADHPRQEMPHESHCFALALVCAGAAFAQSPGADHRRRSIRRSGWMTSPTLLDLTDAQKAQVQTILEQEHAQMKQQFEQAKASGTKPDFTQMKALHQQMQQDTIQKLTPGTQFGAADEVPDR